MRVNRSRIYFNYLLLLIRDYKTKDLNSSSILHYYMKHKLSITIDEDTIFKIQDRLRSKTYRNKSHFFEVAADMLLKTGE